MKVTCTRENLRHALVLSTKIVSGTTTLPILNNVLLKTEPGQLIISSTNLEIAIKVTVGGQIDEPGEITVPARTFTDFITNLTDETVNLLSSDGNLTVHTKTTQSILKGLGSDEFPLIPQVQPKLSLQLSAQEFSDALARVSFAAASSETQPELSGVLLFINDNQLKLVATDRYRLAESIISLPEPAKISEKVIIPNRAVAELLRILTDSEGMVELIVGENQILFRTNQVELTSRVIEGQYPDYEQIIPTVFSSEAKLPTREFGSALKLAGLFATESNSIEIKLEPKTGLVIESTSQKAGSNTTSVMGTLEGEANKVVFNFKYLLDCLTHAQSDKVILKVVNSASPAMLVPDGSTAYRYLVMPIKI